MYKVIKWAYMLLFSGLLAGCSALVDSASDEKTAFSAEGFSIETDQEVYLVEEGDNPLEISYTYVNEGKQPIYPGSCLGGATNDLEKFVDGEWIPAYFPFCARPLGSPLEIKPGERYEVNLRLNPSTWDPARKNGSWYGGDIEGTYRVRERVYGEWSMKKNDSGTLQSEIVVSNSFEIRRAP